MKPWIGLSIGLFLSAGSAQAALPEVSVVVDVHRGSWRPIARADLARAVERAVLDELSRAQKLRIRRGGESDYRLSIQAHLLDEAETHTVSVELGPGKKNDLPSLSASRTVTLSKKSRGKMLELIEKSAREATRALVDVATGPLARLAQPNKKGGEDPFKDAKLPYQWARVEVERPNLGKATRDLYSRNRDRRKAALRQLGSLALTDDTPRQALEACVLDHVDEDMRRECLVALAPISRRVEPTRRVVIEAFRQTDDNRTRREALEQMMRFSGPSYEWAVQALLQAAADGRDSDPLKKLGPVPNLDIAVRSCLEVTGKNKRRENRVRFRCIELLQALPYERRHAIIWKFVQESNPDSPYYLKGAGEREGNIGTPWARGAKSLLESMERWDPALGEVLWRRYQRELSYFAAGALADWAPPSKKLAQRMVEMLKTAGNRASVRGLRRLASEDELKPYIKSEVEEMVALGTFPKSVSERELNDLLKKLEGKR